MYIKQKDTQFAIGYVVTSVMVVICVWLLFPADVSEDTEAAVLVTSLALSVIGGFIAVVIGIWVARSQSQR